jgi:hypothetical protein
MKTKVSLLAFVFLSLYAISVVSPQANPQSTNLRSTLSTLQSTRQEVNALQWRLTELNIQRAYDDEDGFSEKSPVKYERNRQRFTTYFLVPSGSHLLRATSREQLEEFDNRINGLCLELIGALDLPTTSFSEVRNIIEADFITPEREGLFVIGRFRDGKIQLVREKIRLP